MYAGETAYRKPGQDGQHGIADDFPSEPRYTQPVVCNALPDVIPRCTDADEVCVFDLSQGTVATSVGNSNPHRKPMCPCDVIQYPMWLRDFTKDIRTFGNSKCVFSI